MIERAKAYIAKKVAEENADLVFKQYAEVCFRAFLRRLRRDYPAPGSRPPAGTTDEAGYPG